MDSKNLIKTRIAIGLSALLLVACGGGGGSDSSNNNPGTTVVVDDKDETTNNTNKEEDIKPAVSPFADLAGIWDASVFVSSGSSPSLKDEIYIVIDSSGELTEYDYAGDPFAADRYVNCYETAEYQLEIAAGANNYSYSTGFVDPELPATATVNISATQNTLNIAPNDKFSEGRLTRSQLNESDFTPRCTQEEIDFIYGFDDLTITGGNPGTGEELCPDEFGTDGGDDDIVNSGETDECGNPIFVRLEKEPVAENCETAAGEFWRNNCGVSTNDDPESGYARAVQAILWCDGYTTQDRKSFIDGIYGPNTSTAVKSFQLDSGLQSYDSVGRATWNALQNELTFIETRPEFDFYQACDGVNFWYQREFMTWQVGIQFDGTNSDFEFFNIRSF